MYVFSSETKHAFFIATTQSFSGPNEPMAVSYPTMVQPPLCVSTQPMAGPEPAETKPILRKTKTKRGKGKKNKRRKNDVINFSLMGSNSNGLKAKLDSLKSNINIFGNPSCITIQETKLRKSGNIQIPGYQVFQLNRNGSLGGGLLSAVDVGLNPVLVAAGDDEIELLVVQVKIGHLNVRIFNAYGPQEDDTATCKLFWQGLEKEIIRAKQENCCIIIEMDANAKLETETTNMSEYVRYG